MANMADKRNDALRLNEECFALEQRFEEERIKRREAKASGKTPNKTNISRMKEELSELRIRAKQANIAAGLRVQENTIVTVEDNS